MSKYKDAANGFKHSLMLQKKMPSISQSVNQAGLLEEDIRSPDW